MIFVDCPEYLDESGAERCCLPAEVEDLFIIQSTSGPVKGFKIRCIAGHFFQGPASALALPVE